MSYQHTDHNGIVWLRTPLVEPINWEEIKDAARQRHSGRPPIFYPPPLRSEISRWCFRAETHPDSDPETCLQDSRTQWFLDEYIDQDDQNNEAGGGEAETIDIKQEQV